MSLSTTKENFPQRKRKITQVTVSPEVGLDMQSRPKVDLGSNPKLQSNFEGKKREEQPLPPEFTDVQIAAIKAFRDGESMFLTGKAGSGKSFLVNYVISQCFVNSKKWHPKVSTVEDLALVATTGVAVFNLESLHVQPMTLHRLLGLGIEEDATPSYAGKRRLKQINVLIIDEVSLLKPRIFDLLDKTARQVKQKNVPFGGIQIVAVGDFLQLPPVKEAHFVFQNPLWRKHFLTFCFKKSYRQIENPEFEQMLNSIRTGEIFYDTDMKYKFESCLQTPPSEAKCRESLILFGTNEEKNKENLKRMAEKLVETKKFPNTVLAQMALNAQQDLSRVEFKNTKCYISHTVVQEIKLDPSTTPITTKMYDILPFAVFHAMAQHNPKERKVASQWLRQCSKSSGLAETLILFCGMKVMLRKNIMTEQGLVNGRIGTVVGFTEEQSCPPKCLYTKDGMPVVRRFPIVFFPAVNNRRSITQEIFPFAEKLEQKRGKSYHLIAARSQVPLMSAWASTVHLVQGLTLPKITIDCSHLFDAGMFYVALSRVRKMSDAYVRNLQWDQIATPNASCLRYYDELERREREREKAISEKKFESFQKEDQLNEEATVSQQQDQQIHQQSPQPQEQQRQQQQQQQQQQQVITQTGDLTAFFDFQGINMDELFQPFS